MVYFVLSYLVLSSIFLIGFGNIINKKYLALGNLFAYFALLEFVLYPLTGYKIASYHSYQIVVYILSIGFIVGSISFIGWLGGKHKDVIKMEAGKNQSINLLGFSAIVLLLVLLILFTDKIFYDTSAYQSVSQNFKHNIYAMNDNSLRNEYAVVTQYFVASVFDEIGFGYYIFNPIITGLIVLLLYIFLADSENKGVSYLVNPVVCIGIAFFYSLGSYDSTGGNLSLQSILLFATLILVYKKQYYLIPLLCATLMFYSSTGIVLGIALFASLICYFFITDKGYGVMFLLCCFAIALPPAFIVIVSKINNGSHGLKLVFVALSYLATLLCIGAVLLFKWKEKKWVGLDKVGIANKIQSNLFMIIGNILFQIFNILLIVFIFTNVVDTTYTLKYCVIATFIFNLCCSGIMFYFGKKEQEINLLCVFFGVLTIVITAMLGIVKIIPIKALNNNASLGRLIFLTPIFGELPDIIVFCISLVYIIVNRFNDVADFNFREKKKFIPSYIGLGTMMLTTAIIPPIQSATILQNGTLPSLKFSSDIFKNIHHFSKKDFDGLSSDQFAQLMLPGKKVFSSVPYQFAYNNGVNDVSSIAIGILLDVEGSPMASGGVNSYGYVNASLKGAKKNNKIDFYNSRTNQDFFDAAVATNSEVYILLKSDKSGFNSSSFTSIYEGDDILVYTK